MMHGASSPELVGPPRNRYCAGAPNVGGPHRSNVGWPSSQRRTDIEGDYSRGPVDSRSGRVLAHSPATVMKRRHLADTREQHCIGKNQDTCVIPDNGRREERVALFRAAVAAVGTRASSNRHGRRIGRHGSAEVYDFPLLTRGKGRVRTPEGRDRLDSGRARRSLT